MNPGKAGLDLPLGGNTISIPESSVKKLSNWYLKSVFPLRKGVTLVIEGVLLPQKQLWRCGPIMTVTDRTNVLTLNKSRYKLEGEMDLEKSVKNGFSNIYSQYVQNGFPDNWRYVLRTRILGRSSEETVLYDREVEKIKKRKRRDHPSFQIPPPSSEQSEPIFPAAPPSNPSFAPFQTQEPFQPSNSFSSFATIPLTTTEQRLPSSVEMMEQVFPVGSVQNPVISGNEVFNNDLLSVFQPQLPLKPKRRPGRPKGSKNKTKRAPGEKKKGGRKRKVKSSPVQESTLSLQLPISDVSSSMIQSNALPLDLPLDTEETSDLVGMKTKNGKESQRKGNMMIRKGKGGAKGTDSIGSFTSGVESLGDAQFEQLARKGTLKYRNQIRQLVEKHDSEVAAENDVHMNHLFEDSNSFDPNLFLNVKDPEIQTTARKNSLDTLSFSFVYNEDTQFEPFEMRELDRVIVDEQKVSKSAKKRSATGTPAPKKRAISVVDDNPRARVRASLSANGETSIQVIDKNDGCIPTSDEEIMSDDDFESDSDYLSVC